MTGLLLKDFYLMRSLAKSYLLVLGVFAVLTVTGIYSSGFMASFLALMCIMFPVNLFAYDEQARWDKYAAALPAGRVGAVKARYLFTLIVCLGAILLSGVLQAAAFLVGKGEGPLVDTVFSGVIPAAFGTLMNAVLLPLLYRFGAQRGRIYLLVTMGVAFGLAFGSVAALGQLGVDLSAILLPLALLPVLCVLALVPSYHISLGVYRKKDL